MVARSSGVQNAGILLNHSYVSDVGCVGVEEILKWEAVDLMQKEIKKRTKRDLNVPIYSFLTDVVQAEARLARGRVRRAFRGGEDL